MNAELPVTIEEIAGRCQELGVELLEVLSTNGRGSRFVARVRTHDEADAILKQRRAARPGERAALQAWGLREGPQGS